MDTPYEVMSWFPFLLERGVSTLGPLYCIWFSIGRFHAMAFTWTNHRTSWKSLMETLQMASWIDNSEKAMVVGWECSNVQHYINNNPYPLYTDLTLSHMLLCLSWSAWVAMENNYGIGELCAPAVVLLHDVSGRIPCLLHHLVLKAPGIPPLLQY